MYGVWATWRASQVGRIFLSEKLRFFVKITNLRENSMDGETSHDAVESLNSYLHFDETADDKEMDVSIGLCEVPGRWVQKGGNQYD